MSITVHTQAELDAAIKAGHDYIDIRSERGVWLDVSAPKKSTVTAYGSSTVRACDSSTVTARDSSTVTAYDSSTVTAYDSSTVTAYDSSTVTAYDSSTVTACGSSTVTACDSSTVTACGSSTVRARDSSTVTACGSSTVRARGSSTVRACDSSTVRACDSSTVTAYDSSTVTARDSSTVTAYDSSTVTTYDSSTVTAKSRVAVHLHSGRAKIDGGVLIDHTQEPTDPAAWCAYRDVEVSDGIATVYKAVNDKWTTHRGADYSPGSLPECDDWTDNHECGGGLHFSPLPIQALTYHPTATRFVAVGVAVADLRPILGGTPKCKAPRVVRACVEVDVDGKAVES